MWYVENLMVGELERGQGFNIVMQTCSVFPGHAGAGIQSYACCVAERPDRRCARFSLKEMVAFSLGCGLRSRRQAGIRKEKG